MAEFPLLADAGDLEGRADHLNKVLNAVSVCVNAILDDTAQNVPSGLDLARSTSFFPNSHLT